MSKKTLLIALLGISFSLNAQNNIKDFQLTSNNVMMKTEKSNPDGQKIELGDVVIGKFSIYYGDTLVYNGMNQPSQPLFPVVKENNMFKGDLIDGLQLLHQGETATFAFPKDSMLKYPTGIPKDIKADYIFYKVKVDSVTTIAKMQQEEQKLNELKQKQADSLKAIEQTLIDNYINNSDWNKTKTDGIYVKHLQAGTGAKAQDGDRVKMNYTGQLLDGTVFDSSIESVAKENNLYNAQRKYEPLEFIIGKGQMIKGFEAAARQLQKGGKAIVLIPSELAYGGRDLGIIKPYSPLIFTVELVEISK